MTDGIFDPFAIKKPEGSGSTGIVDPFAAPAVRPTPTASPTLQRGQSEDGDFMRGLKRTLPELKQLAGGTAALIGDTVGWDGLRDKGMQLYREQEDKLAPLQKPTDSATEAWNQVKQGNLGAGIDFLQNAAGYTTGQAAESLVAAGAGALVGGIAGSEVPVAGNAAGAVLGGVGGFVAKSSLKRGVKAAAEKLVEEQVAKGVAKDVAKKEAADFVARNTAKDALKEQVGKAYTERELAKLGGKAAGGAIGANAMNATMELGSIYPDAQQQAQAEGRDLTGGDLAKVWAGGLAAAGVETAADMVNLGKLFGGVKDAATKATESGFKAAAKAYIGRAAREGGEAALREAGTEGVQTELERAGASQSLTDADAMRDVIDSMAVGAVGGVFFGGVAALHPQGENAKQQSTLKRSKPLGADPADALRANVLQAAASGDAGALQQAHGALVDYLQKTGRMLPAPTVSVDSTGAAGTEAQWEARTRAGLPAEEPIVARGSLGDSPDVQAAAPAHPGSTRHTPFPDAPAGSLSDAVNVTAAQEPAHAARGSDAAGTQPAELPVAGGADSLERAPVADHAPGSLGEAAATTEAHAPTPAAAPAVPAEVAPSARPDTSTTSPAPESADALAPAPVRAGAADASAPDSAPAVGQGSEVQAASPSAQDAAPTDQGAVTAAVDAAAHEAATSPQNDLPAPTEAQKEAGNYKKGHVQIAGLDVSIENPAGSKRNEAWPELAHHYGYIKGTVGKDKDHVDVFLTEHAADTSRPVFVVDQHNKDGGFDEHKVVLGAQTADEARAAYKANYSADWNGDGHVTQMTHAEFEAWVRDPNATQRPAAEAMPERATARPSAESPAAQAAPAQEPAPAPAPAEAPAAEAPAAAPADTQSAGEGVASATPETAGAHATPTGPERFTPKGKKAERGFGKPDSVRAELEKAGLNPDHYTIERTKEGGYVGVRKAAPTAGAPEAAPEATPPAHHQDDAEKAKAAATRKQIDEAFAANRKAVKDKGLKKGDTVTYEANGRTVTGTIAHLGDADQRVIAVSVKGERGVADYHVPASQLTKVDPTAATSTTPTAGEKAAAVPDASQPTNEVAAKWDTLGYAERQAIAKRAGYAMQNVLHRLALSKWDKVTPAEQAKIAAAMTAEPAAAPVAEAPKAEPTKAEKAAAEKQAKAAARERQATVFRDLLADRSLVGKGVREVEAAIRKAGEGVISDADVERMAKSLHKEIAKGAAEREKDQHRDPAILQAEIESGSRARQLTEPEALAAYTSGWHHFLKGKTKSTLAGDNLPALLHGYRDAQAWADTDEGRAFYEGKPRKKLENTGADLKRAMDLLRAAAEAAKSNGTKLWAAMKRATVRADLFPIAPPASATPGVTRMLEHVRGEMKTFTDYFGRRVGDSLLNVYSKSYSAPWLNTERGGRYDKPVDVRVASFIDRLLGDEFSFEKILDAPEGEWLKDPHSYSAGRKVPPLREISVEARREKLLELAEQYVDDVKFVREAFAGVKTAAEFLEAAKHIRESKPVERLGLHSALDTEGRFSDLKRYVDYENNPIQKGDKAKPLTPPRLDKIDRTLPGGRDGRDVTPKEFKETFGFADVGFGNWVGSKSDQDHLNYAFDALTDLAAFYGIPKNMVGFNGRLHFTIGALGSGGKAAAHFQLQHPHPNGGTVPVINLTNTKGDGTVAHEWLHALDLFGLGNDPGWKHNGFGKDRILPGKPSVRDTILDVLRRAPLTVEAVEATARRFLMEGSYWRGMKSEGALAGAMYAMGTERIERHFRADTSYHTEANKLGKDYWGNNEEMLARASEAWMNDTLPGVNTYLVNPGWVGDSKVTPASGYRGIPYPQGQERKHIAAAFDALRKALVVKDGQLTVDRAAFFEHFQDPSAAGYARAAELREKANMEAFAAELTIKDAAAKAERQAAADAKKRAEQAELDRLAAAQLAELEPAPTPTVMPSDTMGPPSELDLEALFDQAAAELREELHNEPEAPAPGEQVAELADKARLVPKRTEGGGVTYVAEPVKGEKAPELTAAQEKTAGALVAEAAKLGVSGLEDAMKGLVQLFGGPARLNSFPAGFDADTYAKAKPHFQSALEKFQAAGKSLKDLFKLLIQTFGDGIKPYAIQFAKENQLTAELGTAPSASAKLAGWVKDMLDQRQQIDWRTLFERADAAFGGTQAEGTYTPKDAYDALEAGVNRYLMSKPNSYTPTANAEAAVHVIEALGQWTNGLLPTQSKRTAEQDEFQQFSTVPAFAYAANWVANLSDADTVLEPSAGVGGLATFAQIAGAKLVLNELSSRRAAVLQEVFPGSRVFRENAEQIDNVLPANVLPTVVVMNPPFSATAGRMQGTRKTSVGAQHVEQALERLADNGRLVAIVGDGMRLDAPAFKEWWAKIQKKYDVRAVIPVDGTGYAKYGTTFDNALLVIDKRAPVADRSPVTTPAKEYADLVGLLSEIRNDRPIPSAPAADPFVERDAAVAERDAAADERGQAPGAEQPGAPGPAGVPGGAVREPGAGRNGAGRGGQRGGARSGGGVREPGGSTAGDGQDAGRGGRAAGEPTEGSATGVAIEAGHIAPAAELTDSVFEGYQPQRLKVPGAKPHPGPLVQSAAMASVLPPAPTYTPNLPKATIEGGKLSIAQIESIVYAGQAHQQTLPNGERRGFFIGDGTGVGKGREIGGIMLDNLREGRKKAVWISEKQGLENDAKRDFEGVGGDPAVIFNQSKTKAEESIPGKDGILFTTYSTLRSGAQSQDTGQATAKQLTDHFKGATAELQNGRTVTVARIDPKKQVVHTTYGSRYPFASVKNIDDDPDWQSWKPAPKATGKKAGKSRLDQLVEWLGPDFDGVIAFDEAHNAGNAVAVKGERGPTKPSAQALAVVELQKKLPKARVVYVSATGATVVSNLSYATRLGLWGEGTPFPSVEDFIAKMEAGGLSTMELVARDMKQQGAYLARSLSYDGVTYSRLEHQLDAGQTEIYDRLADAWQTVLANFEEALKATGAVAENGKSLNPKAVSAAKSAFWGGQQRFFNQVITAMQMPSVLEQMEKDLAAGDALVLQLVNTNEAAMERALAERKEEGDDASLEDLDLTPRDQLMQMVEKAFPVVQMEEYTDENGKRGSRAVTGADGQPVLNKKMVEKRDALLKDLENIRVPDGPLEMVLNHFGYQQTAEVTGRSRRVVAERGDKGETRMVEQKRGPSAARADATAFMDDKKRILIFSDAGGTGFSFQADLTKKNQRKRKHYLIQPGWRADKAVQGFGRTHRTNQASAPHYYLAATNIPAHKRFLSSIARRLDQLGALTKGQRDASSQGMFSAADNLESVYAKQAVQQLFEDALNDQVQEFKAADFLRQLGFENIVDVNTGKIADGKMPPTSQFLNRMLSLKLDMQEKVFDAFMARVEEKIAVAKERGEFDEGMQTIKALESRVVNESTLYTDPRTQAETKLIELELTVANKFFDFPNLTRFPQGSAVWMKNDASGRVYLQVKSGTKTLKNGTVVDKFRLYGTGGMQVKDATEMARGYRELSDAEAAAAWQAETEKRPKTVTKPLYLISGAILPIWDRLDTGQHKLEVARTQTTDGQRLLGRVVMPGDLAEVRKRFNVTSAAAKMAPAQVMAEILKGKTAQLANGWSLVRARVSDELRVEIKAGYLMPAVVAELERAGAINERINFQTRLFVPTGAAGVPVLAKITESKPVVDLVDPNAAASEDDAKFSRPDPARTLGPGAWFKQSKVVNERGAPLVVHHGTAEDFGIFEDRSGESSLHASSGLGFFFAEDKPVAQYYAETASRGVPADERIVDAYLSIQNPKRLSLEDMQAFDHVDEARAYRAHLEKQGYDGIHVPESGIWIAFKPNQIKSAFENNGDFDPANPDIRYSTPGAPITGGGMGVMALSRLVGDLTRGWGKNAPKVYVVADASSLPTWAKRSQGWEAAEGFYDERTGGVYLIASNLANAQRAREVLLHEAVGHYGLEQIVGPVEWAKIADTLRAMRASGKYAELFDEIGRRYAGVNEGIFVREAMAVMAEKGVQNGLVDRVVAAMRRFLRSLGMNLRLSEAELRQLIASAARYVRDGARPREALRPQAEAVEETLPLFSQPDPGATVAAAADVASAPPASVVNRVKEAFGALRENTRPGWLGALTLRHLAELGKDIGLTQVGEYADRVQQMATDRNVMQEEAAAVADPWAQFQRKDRKGADETANLMHDTTIAGLDPSIDYRPLMTGTTKRGASEPVTRESVARRSAAIEAELAAAPSEQAELRLDAELADLQHLLQREEARKAAYPALVQRYLALPEKGRELYVAAKKAYAAQSDRLQQAIIERIEATGAAGRTRAEMIDKIRAHFEASRIEGPYFPLARFGEFWISATARDGSPFFSMYENAQEWAKARRELAAQGYAEKAAGRKIAESRGVAGVSQGFMADLEKLLDSAGVDDATRDDVWQLFLRSLPDLSMRKHSIHRKKTAGYSKDALRAFASNMFHGSFQIARVRHTHELEAALLAMRNATTAMTETDPEKAVKAAALTGEANLRHEWVMNPKDSKNVSKLTGLGFLWYLGATPASALTNLTQTAIVTLPVLSARFGASKSAAALTTGMARALRNIDGNLTRGLTDEEKSAFKVWHESGAIDRTASSGLAGLAETDSATFNPVARRTMQVVSWLFHHTEMVNREATALAAFRLAREAGDDFATATKYAAEVINESHFDYTNANRARFMQGNAAKVLLLFRQYSLNMTWLLWRNAYLGLRGETPEVRKAARIKLAGVTGMTALFAGTMGLPLMSVMFGIANAAAAAFGDDEDEPFDAEVAFRNFLADHLGGALAHAVTDGPVSTLTGADIGSRVSLNDLWLHDPDRELEGQAKADYLLEQAAGPVAGGMLVNTLRGWQLMQQGNVERGIETMMPKAVKDAMKSVRFATQGVNTLRGDPLIEDLGVGGVALQLAGFSPTSLAQRYDANNAAKNYERGMLDRRQALLDAYALAWRADDGDTLGKVRDKIVAWNDANPELGITMATIRSSLVDRVRYSARAEGGVVLDRRVAEKAKAQARFGQ